MRGWIGVGLDGTLALYDGWKGETVIGDPVPHMVSRVKKWLDLGQEVKIMTARVSSKDNSPKAIERITRAIQAWTLEHIGVKLEVTAEKDLRMIELWDDRCVQVVKNIGVPILDPVESL